MESFASVAIKHPALEAIAKKNFPNGSVIQCLKCRLKRNCTTSEIAGWMQSGFPKCGKCGATTDLVNPWLSK